jgi:hypothetical protein
MKQFIVLLCLALAFTSCKKEDSIQTYFVEHQERPDYSVVDISSSLLDLKGAGLNKEEQEALDSFDKLHVLLYKATDSTQADYEKELKSINKVFKNEAYPELFVFNDNGMRFKIHTVGESEEVDEILVLANSSQMGFVAIRVLGNDMDATKMATLVSKLQSSEVNNDKLKGIMNFLQ